MNELLERARHEREYMVALRRSLHRHPELSGRETVTRDTILAELHAMEIPCEVVAGTGVIGTLRGGGGAQQVVLRADMDALPLQEENESDYRSEVPGVMHACGHDGHVAALLGAARLLRAKPPKNDVLFVFQPAEETMRGAKAMAEHPALLEADAFAGVHLWPTLPVGSINVEAGPRMARADLFSVEILGAGSHGSMPQMGVDAAYIGCLLCTAAQAVVSRQTDPREPAVLSFGSVKAGTAPNVLAAHALLSGTLRSADDTTGLAMIENLRRLVTHIPAAFGASGELRIDESVPPVINDAHCARIAADCALALVGESGMAAMPCTTGSEDFSYFQKHAPGVFAFVGAGNADKGASFPLHHSRFDMDEDALVYAAAFLALFAQAFYRQP